MECSDRGAIYMNWVHASQGAGEKEAYSCHERT